MLFIGIGLLLLMILVGNFIIAKQSAYTIFICRAIDFYNSLAYISMRSMRLILLKAL